MENGRYNEKTNIFRRFTKGPHDPRTVHESLSENEAHGNPTMNPMYVPTTHTVNIESELPECEGVRATPH